MKQTLVLKLEMMLVPALVLDRGYLLSPILPFLLNPLKKSG